MDAQSPVLPLHKFLRLMCWMYYRALLARVRGLREQSRLLITVLVSFIVGYLVVGYLLFYYGLGYIYDFPVIGTLLSQRILYLIFGFFMVMLVFSNVIAAYTTFFKNRETAWLLTVPVRHRHVFLWKFLESMVVSSWALIFLSAPMMAAYGRVHQADWSFYWQVLIVYFPFVVLPSVVGSWLILLIVRLLMKGWVKYALLGASAVLMLLLVVNIRPTSEQDAVSMVDVVSFERLLQHTRVSLNPLLPSAWVSRAIVAASQGLTRESQFYFWLLTSNAAFGMALAYGISGKFFYGSWTDAATTRTRKYEEGILARNRSIRKSGDLLDRILERVPGLSLPAKAMLAKDLRVFWRDPAQWSQFAVFFGLLCIYVLNLRNVAYDFGSEFWGTVISYLNLGACALTLSTLTTRFVFPQFSLEGRRLWVIGLAPVGLPRILMQKFWTSTIGAALVTVSLMVASSVTLRLEVQQVVFFGISIALMSATLSGLAVGLGALFPNLKEDNPSKIVSGFGGTLCLVASFIYITLFIALLVLAVGVDFSDRELDFTTRFFAKVVCYSLALVLSAVAMLLPLKLALRRVKNLEFF